MSFPLVGHQTISLGVAEVSPNELPCQALMRADMALFKAKANGRDRVEAAA
jgi:Response regulator containing a CheY-like receiver domain and a GGDEF domain